MMDVVGGDGDDDTGGLEQLCIEAINAAHCAKNKDGVETKLAEVQEIVLHRDSSLLPRYFGKIVEFQCSLHVPARRFVLTFAEKVLKKAPREYLQRCAELFLFMMSDTNSAVTKIAIRYAGDVFRTCLQTVCSDTGAVSPAVASLWRTMSKLKQTVTQLVGVNTSANDGVRSQAIKFIETVAILCSFASGGVVSKKGGFSLDDVPAEHRLLNTASMREEGIAMLRHLRQLTLNDSMTKSNFNFVITALGNIAKQRPALCDSAIPPLLQLYLAPPAQLEASAKKSVVKATKHMLNALSKSKVPLLSRWHSAITGTLAGQSAATIPAPTPETLVVVQAIAAQDISRPGLGTGTVANKRHKSEAAQSGARIPPEHVLRSQLTVGQVRQRHGEGAGMAELAEMVIRNLAQVLPPAKGGPTLAGSENNPLCKLLRGASRSSQAFAAVLREVNLGLKAMASGAGKPAPAARDPRRAKAAAKAEQGKKAGAGLKRPASDASAGSAKRPRSSAASGGAAGAGGFLPPSMFEGVMPMEDCRQDAWLRLLSPRCEYGMGMTGKTGSDLRLALLARIAVAQPLHEDLHKLLQGNIVAKFKQKAANWQELAVVWLYQEYSEEQKALCRAGTTEHNLQLASRYEAILLGIIDALNEPAEGSTEVAADAAPSTLMVHISGDVSALGAEDVEAFEKQATALVAARSTQLAADDIQAIILSPGAAAGSTIGSVVLAASVSTSTVEAVQASLVQAPLALTLGGKAFTSSTVDVELSAGAKRPCALLPETEEQIKQLLKEAPHVTDGVIAVVRAWCVAYSSVQEGLGILTHLIFERPAARSKVLQALLSFTAHKEDSIRERAVRVVVKELWDKPSSVGQACRADVTQFATTQFKSLISGGGGGTTKAEQARLLRQDAINNLAKKTPGTDEHSAAQEEVRRWTEEAREAANDAARAAVEQPARRTRVEPTEEEVTRSFHLYVALCTRQPDMLLGILDVFTKLNKGAQRILFNDSRFGKAVKHIGSNNDNMVVVEQLLHNFQPEGFVFVLKVLQILKGAKKIRPALLRTVKDVYAKRKGTLQGRIRLLVPFLGYFETAEVLALLPKVVALLPKERVKEAPGTRAFEQASRRGATSANTFEKALDYLFSASPCPLDPKELLIALHTVMDQRQEAGDPEPGPNRFQCFTSVELCLKKDKVFRYDVLKKVLSKVVDMTPLPKIFMPTCIKALQACPKLMSMVETQIVKRCIGKKVWKDKTQWKGFKALVERFQFVGELRNLPKKELVGVLKANKHSLYAPFAAYMSKYRAQNKIRDALEEAKPPGGGQDQGGSDTRK